MKFNHSVQLFTSGEDGKTKDYCSATKDELVEYIDAGIVEGYGIDYVVELTAKEWNLSNIKAEFHEKLGCTGKKVKVAVIDTGLVPGIASNALEGNTDTTDNLMHGTIVSALIASPYGVSCDAQFVPLKCFDEGVKTYTSDILDAVEDAVDVFGCDVLNMSFTFTGEANSLAIHIFFSSSRFGACCCHKMHGQGNRWRRIC